MELTTEVVRELLEYDKLTGVFTWKVRAREWFKSEKSFKRFNDNYAGKVVGTVNTNVSGYRCISLRLLKKSYLAHRIAFLWMGEALPEQVDHKDRDGTNNTWLNLIPSTAQDNLMNKSMSRANKSGVTGVHWDERSQRWRATVMIKQKQYHVGMFASEDLHLAAEAVKVFRSKNGFSEGHGEQQPNKILTINQQEPNKIPTDSLTRYTE